MKEKFGSVTWACRNKVRKAKAQFRMHKERRIFYNYITEV